MTSNYCRQAPKLQRGAALFISLILLLVLTMIGASAIQTVSLEERMAANLKNQNLALAAAESALRDAEHRLTPWPSPDDNKQLPLVENREGGGILWVWKWDEPHPLSGEADFDPDEGNEPWWVERDKEGYGWWSDNGGGRGGGGNSHSYGLTHELYGLSVNEEEVEAPLYVIENKFKKDNEACQPSYEEPCLGTDIFRITARSPGGSNNAVKYLQSIFTWRYY